MNGGDGLLAQTAVCVRGVRRRWLPAGARSAREVGRMQDVIRLAEFVCIAVFAVLVLLDRFLSV